MKNVVIVDDHPLIRMAVRMMLEKEGYSVVAECETGADCIQAVRTLRPDLVILDLSIPNLDGFSVISRLKAAGLPVKILVLTSSDSNYAIRCLQAGASGFIGKDDNLDELLGAVKAVLSGYTYFPQAALNMLQENVQTTISEEGSLIASLTDREITILKLLAQGMSNQKIASTLMISHKTVSTYKVGLMRKLGVTNLVALVKLAERNGVA